MTLDEFYQLGEQHRGQLSVFEAKIFVCSGSGCSTLGSESLVEQFEQVCESHGLKRTVRLVKTGCMGLCGSGPLVRIQPGSKLYSSVTPSSVEDIVKAHFLDERAHSSDAKPPDTPFFSKQRRIVVEQLGIIDPNSIEDYIAHGGYQALAKAVCYHTTGGVAHEIRKSGLRGRSGSGEYAGLKWDYVRKAGSDRKYVVCDANEGDPGSFLERTLLEGNPHLILEGMTIAGYAVGATHGIIYIRNDYEVAIKRLRQAIQQAERTRILGNRIFDSEFTFRIDIRTGGGDYVCLEETALIASIEGNRAVPRPKPPHPLLQGLWGKPTLIHNVETYCNVPVIMRKGARWYTKTGTANSKGTKLFALTGDVIYSGIVEVPMGTSLREIVYDIGGGPPDGKTIKAVITGGPSGGWIPEKQLDVQVDYENMAQLGTTVGAGGMLVVADDQPMVTLARHFMDFSARQSCGKCVPCRVGTVQVAKILRKFESRSATAMDLDNLEELCTLLKNTSLCRLGTLAPAPIISSLHYFRDEYEELLAVNQSDLSEEAMPNG